ncbi:DNA-binding protein [Campylobacter mucosalis]|uniref:Uncharacterized protein n=1 Tax=Campylobacter mucosalis CCUG 21559 TaxID=1032067 RepID=A0A6G5QFR0_9BACT|nr:hypothetical protein [Campylobacter mucosalis]QCD44407.1 hypothetical protein CMUC_0608 [Campylobacter mucosalis CCUG 21559]QKF63668.1 hypothetical protein CMCT_1555 [Campylobacter mucosalis]
MREKFTEFKVEDYLTSDELRREYLNQVLADGDIDELKRAISNVAISKGVDCNQSCDSKNDEQNLQTT